MNTTKKVIGTIDLTPTWVSAARIYIAVLKNPKAGIAAISAAEEDLLNLAKFADKVIADKKHA